MTKNSMSSTGSTWAGMVPVDDTALAVTDTGGPGIPVVYLNGQFATQGYWRRVVAELGTGWRHTTYDERARGKSKRSADYSFEAAVRDVDAVLAARGVDRALLVGWSYEAVVRLDVGHLPGPLWLRVAGRPRPRGMAANRRTRPHPPGQDRHGPYQRRRAHPLRG
ncbi:alpha/beta fold hydrolase [Streptomyces sp. CA-106131]|uniref:alpha/beta fold hydrolase n=1 Tax=Streptomyces sp. CA-106131 TaxID=3240045 RepID=UPI003D908135